MLVGRYVVHCVPDVRLEQQVDSTLYGTLMKVILAVDLQLRTRVA
jgi:hypothetical protein